MLYDPLLCGTILSYSRKRSDKLCGKTQTNSPSQEQGTTLRLLRKMYHDGSKEKKRPSIKRFVCKHLTFDSYEKIVFLGTTRNGHDADHEEQCPFISLKEGLFDDFLRFWFFPMI